MASTELIRAKLANVRVSFIPIFYFFFFFFFFVVVVVVVFFSFLFLFLFFLKSFIFFSTFVTFLSQLFKIYYTYVQMSPRDTERHRKKNHSPSLHTRAVHVTRFSRVLRNGETRIDGKRRVCCAASCACALQKYSLLRRHFRKKNETREEVSFPTTFK